MLIFVLGIDLGKNVCSLVGLDRTGAVVLRRRLRRDDVVDFVGKMEPCIVAMEACCGAHHLGRVLGSRGHTIRLMSPEYVRPYVKANKNDDHDAEAIAEAATSMVLAQSCRASWHKIHRWAAGLEVCRGGHTRTSSWWRWPPNLPASSGRFCESSAASTQRSRQHRNRTVVRRKADGYTNLRVVRRRWPDSRTAAWKPEPLNGHQGRCDYEDQAVRISILAGARTRDRIR